MSGPMRLANRLTRSLDRSQLKASSSAHVRLGVLARSIMSKPQTPVKLAILDDYLDLAAPHFQNVEHVEKVIFKDALPAWTHPTTTSADRQRILDRLSPFTILCTMRERTPFPTDLIQQLPNLRLLLCTGTQHSTFDLAAAQQRGIHVALATGKRNAPAADIRHGASHPTTQHTWALLLALANGVAADDRVLKTAPARWQSAPTTRLRGRTLGVVGLGRLGAAVAKIAVQSWGMRVVCWSAHLTQARADQMAVEMGLGAEGAGEKTFRVVEKEELFATADVVTVHYVLSPRSRHLVGEEELASMKPSALLVNTSRGPLVDEEALLRVLERGGIRGAALDVFDIEPLPAESPWRSLKWGQEGRSQVLLSPHMGYVEEGVVNAWYAETAENVERWIRGEELLDRVV